MCPGTGQPSLDLSIAYPRIEMGKICLSRDTNHQKFISVDNIIAATTRQCIDRPGLNRPPSERETDGYDRLGAAVRA